MTVIKLSSSGISYKQAAQTAMSRQRPCVQSGAHSQLNTPVAGIPAGSP